jgi:hypothetical protein
MDFCSGQGVKRSNSSTIARLYNAAMDKKTQFYVPDSVQHHTKCHLAAGAAPRCPKVHQQRDLVALQVLVKRGLGQVNRLASKQRLLALPAVGRAGKLVSTDAVGRLAVGADDVEWFAHTG